MFSSEVAYPGCHVLVEFGEIKLHFLSQVLQACFAVENDMRASLFCTAFFQGECKLWQTHSTSNLMFDLDRGRGDRSREIERGREREAERERQRGRERGRERQRERGGEREAERERQREREREGERERVV